MPSFIHLLLIYFTTKDIKAQGFFKKLVFLSKNLVYLVRFAGGEANKGRVEETRRGAEDKRNGGKRDKKKKAER